MPAAGRQRLSALAAALPLVWQRCCMFDHVSAQGRAICIGACHLAASLHCTGCCRLEQASAYLLLPFGLSNAHHWLPRYGNYCMCAATVAFLQVSASRVARPLHHCPAGMQAGVVPFTWCTSGWGTPFPLPPPAGAHPPLPPPAATAEVPAAYFFSPCRLAAASNNCPRHILALYIFQCPCVALQVVLGWGVPVAINWLLDRLARRRFLFQRRVRAPGAGQLPRSCMQLTPAWRALQMHAHTGCGKGPGEGAALSSEGGRSTLPSRLVAAPCLQVPSAGTYREQLLANAHLLPSALYGVLLALVALWQVVQLGERAGRGAGQGPAVCCVDCCPQRSAALPQAGLLTCTLPVCCLVMQEWHTASSRPRDLPASFCVMCPAPPGGVTWCAPCPAMGRPCRGATIRASSAPDHTTWNVNVLHSEYDWIHHNKMSGQ
jgi:hypothetical protein